MPAIPLIYFTLTHSLFLIYYYNTHTQHTHTQTTSPFPNPLQERPGSHSLRRGTLDGREDAGAAVGLRNFPTENARVLCAAWDTPMPLEHHNPAHTQTHTHTTDLSGTDQNYTASAANP